jgi:ankyrin repeat protein
VRLLAECWQEGAKVKNEAWETPLHRAAQAGRTTVVSLLVDCWPEGIRLKDSHGNTPLHWAAAEGWTDLVKFFAER